MANHALDMTPTFGIVGGGWRADFYLRINRERPEQFPCAGVVVRNRDKRERFKTRWSVPVFENVDELLEKGRPAFVVTSVPWGENLPLMQLLSSREIPVLSETPVAPSLEDLHQAYHLVTDGARIQVAEQYLFQPLHAARLKLVRDGKLGPIHEADVSCAHGYHGLSLLRRYLQAGMRLPQVSARQFESQLVNGPDRDGPPKEKSVGKSERIIAQLDFGDRLGIFDFTGDQYFSWIRSPRLMVRGEEGEINGSHVRLLRDFRTPYNFQITRRDTGLDGNLEGYSHQALIGGGEILYENPFPGARWSDDEIAIATSLEKMKHYVLSGEDFYSVAEACQDRYLDLLMGHAIESGSIVKGTPQPWH